MKIISRPFDDSSPRPIGNQPTVWHIGGEDIHLRIPLLQALQERGFQVGAVGTSDGKAFASQHIPYFRYELERGISPLADRRTAQQLLTLFQAHQPDIIHGFDTKPAMLAPLMAKAAGIPGRVRTITGMGYVFSSHSPIALALRPIYRNLQRQTSAVTDCTIFQNSDDQAYFHNHKLVAQHQDALVLGSGIDVESLVRQRPDPETMARLRQELDLDGKLVVTMVARLVRSKGVQEYLDAAAIVAQQIPNVKFLLIGPRSSEGRQAIAERAIQQAKAVTYLGSRPDIPALLAVSDMFVLPSFYREGIPRALLEAGAMELPLITTDTPGCREVVLDGWNGLLVEPRQVPALAEAIIRLLTTEHERVLMGQRSRFHVTENFSLKQVADAYAQVYLQVLAQSRRDQRASLSA
jgi:glycosyltransferase involved in cell wall biosynthesis